MSQSDGEAYLAKAALHMMCFIVSHLFLITNSTTQTKLRALTSQMHPVWLVWFPILPMFHKCRFPSTDQQFVISAETNNAWIFVIHTSSKEPHSSNWVWGSEHPACSSPAATSFFSPCHNPRQVAMPENYLSYCALSSCHICKASPLQLSVFLQLSHFCLWLDNQSKNKVLQTTVIFPHRRWCARESRCDLLHIAPAKQSSRSFSASLLTHSHCSCFAFCFVCCSFLQLIPVQHFRESSKWLELFPASFHSMGTGVIPASPTLHTGVFFLQSIPLQSST